MYEPNPNMPLEIELDLLLLDAWKVIQEYIEWHDDVPHEVVKEYNRVADYFGEYNV